MSIKNKAISFLASLFIISGLLIWPVFAEDSFPADIRPAPEGQSFDGKLVILHSNDVHGAVDGYAKISELRDSFEDQGAEVILIDAGDFCQGDPYVNEGKGENAVSLMNSAGYFLAVPGNHEFDYSVEKLEENLKTADFTVLCANIKKNGKPMFKPGTIFHAKNGADIGFFGLDTPETLTKANPTMVAGISFLSGQDMADCATEEADTLRKEGAETVIAVTHLGVGEESATESDRSLDLYKASKGIDFIIDGHSHTVMTSGEKDEPIQQTGTKFNYVGVIMINKNAEIEDHYLISTEDLPSDSDVESDVNDIKKAVDEKYSAVIGESEIEFEGEDYKNRSQETNSGDLITDAILWYVNNHKELLKGFDGGIVSMLNGGAIRDKILSGKVTKKDIYTVFPFGNTVNIVFMTGEELLESMEAATFCTPDPIGGYPQTAGMEFTIDLNKEYDKGELYPDSTYHRPKSIKRVNIESINGRPFDKDAEYAVCTSNFTASGGDTYYIFGTKEAVETGARLDDVLTEYIKEELGGVLREDDYGVIRGDRKELKNSSTTPDPGGYKVVAGDYLSKIAEKELGDGRRWKEIYDLNRDVIDDPDEIYPGQSLKLPAA